MCVSTLYHSFPSSFAAHNPPTPPFPFLLSFKIETAVNVRREAKRQCGPIHIPAHAPIANERANNRMFDRTTGRTNWTFDRTAKRCGAVRCATTPEKQSKTKQSKAKQSKTKQNKTKQNTHRQFAQPPPFPAWQTNQAKRILHTPASAAKDQNAGQSTTENNQQATASRPGPAQARTNLDKRGCTAHSKINTATAGSYTTATGAHIRRTYARLASFFVFPPL